jgi:hypothetical protein
MIKFQKTLSILFILFSKHFKYFLLFGNFEKNTYFDKIVHVKLYNLFVNFGKILILIKLFILNEFEHFYVVKLFDPLVN